MARVFIAFIILVFAPQVEASDALAEAYNQGNLHYRKGNYVAAIQAYERVISLGVRHGDVYYNLGNAYFKNGQLGRAILSYERARKLMPEDEDVLANLRFVNALKTDRDPEDDANVLTRFLRAIFGFFSLNTLAVLCSVCVFGICGLICLWLFLPHLRLIWGTSLALMIALLLAFGSMLAFNAHHRGVPEAVILSDAASGRSGPGEDFLQVFVLHEGTKVVVERREGQWLLVRLANGIGGWVRAEALAEI